ncbi:hypothetical protein H5410_060780 [Solanum commersonii]|uniref:Uncharacterized protein n=1 Tax=Solanum commersonii TaxID=4109 RepID=A0A9J5W7L1_SOLCO|nr:hypothetical protein H5410_060780 [Solanum commersonii]
MSWPLQSLGGSPRSATAESKEKGESTATPMMTGSEMEMEQDIKKFIGGDYLRGFIPMKGDVFDYANDDDPDRIPDGALVEHRPHFADIWRRYDAQLQTTNGMDLDTFPGCSMLVDAYPINMSDPTTEEERL